MDGSPLAVAVGTLGASIFTLSQKIGGFMISTKDARDDMHSFLDTLSSLHIGLDFIKGGVLEQNCPQEVQQKIVEILERSESLCAKMADLLDKLQSEVLGRRSQWTITSGKVVSRLREHLDSQVSALNIAMSFSNLMSTRDVKSDTGQIRRHGATALHTQQDAQVDEIRKEIQQLRVHLVGKDKQYSLPLIRFLNDTESHAESFRGSMDQEKSEVNASDITDGNKQTLYPASRNLSVSFEPSIDGSFIQVDGEKQSMTLQDPQTLSEDQDDNSISDKELSEQMNESGRQSTCRSAILMKAPIYGNRLIQGSVHYQDISKTLLRALRSEKSESESIDPESESHKNAREVWFDQMKRAYQSANDFKNHSEPLERTMNAFYDMCNFNETNSEWRDSSFNHYPDSYLLIIGWRRYFWGDYPLQSLSQNLIIRPWELIIILQREIRDFQDLEFCTYLRKALENNSADRKACLTLAVSVGWTDIRRSFEDDDDDEFYMQSSMAVQIVSGLCLLLWRIWQRQFGATAGKYDRPALRDEEFWKGKNDHRPGGDMESSVAKAWRSVTSGHLATDWKNEPWYDFPVNTDDLTRETISWFAKFLVILAKYSYHKFCATTLIYDRSERLVKRYFIRRRADQAEGNSKGISWRTVLPRNVQDNLLLLQQ